LSLPGFLEATGGLLLDLAGAESGEAPGSVVWVGRIQGEDCCCMAEGIPLPARGGTTLEAVVPGEDRLAEGGGSRFCDGALAACINTGRILTGGGPSPANVGVAAVLAGGGRQTAGGGRRVPASGGRWLRMPSESSQKAAAWPGAGNPRGCGGGAAAAVLMAASGRVGH
jgi:hypothetical protein